MDYSGSIKKELKNSKKLVRSLVTSLRKKTSSSREAIVVFDQFAGVKATFGQYNFTETLRLVKNRKREGRTRIDIALKIAQCGVFNSTRHEARKITVTVSDSVQSSGANGLRDSSKPLREANVRVAAVGNGKQFVCLVFNKYLETHYLCSKDAFNIVFISMMITIFLIKVYFYKVAVFSSYPQIYMAPRDILRSF